MMMIKKVMAKAVVRSGGTPFERLAYWGTHSGWRYCQGGNRCGNEPILKLSHFEQMVDQIEKESISSYNQKTYTEKDMEDCFNAARENHATPVGSPIKYCSFQDYKSQKLK